VTPQQPTHADASANCTGVSEVAQTLDHLLADLAGSWSDLDAKAICFHAESEQVKNMQSSSRPMSVCVCLVSGLRKGADGAHRAPKARWRAEGAHRFGIRHGHERRRRECAEVSEARGRMHAQT